MGQRSFSKGRCKKREQIKLLLTTVSSCPPADQGPRTRRWRGGRLGGKSWLQETSSFIIAVGQPICSPPSLPSRPHTLHMAASGFQALLKRGIYLRGWEGSPRRRSAMAHSVPSPRHGHCQEVSIYFLNISGIPPSLSILL